MNLKHDIKIYGDLTFRGKCPSESIEQVTLFSRLRKNWPDSLGIIALHPRNEGSRRYSQAVKEKSEGLTIGAADLIIPGSPALVLELKRRDHTKSDLSDEQIKYLLSAKNNGAFSCIALGCDAAIDAIKDYLKIVAK